MVESVKLHMSSRHNFYKCFNILSRGLKRVERLDLRYTGNTLTGKRGGRSGTIGVVRTKDDNAITDTIKSVEYIHLSVS